MFLYLVFFVDEHFVDGFFCLLLIQEEVQRVMALPSFSLWLDDANDANIEDGDGVRIHHENSRHPICIALRRAYMVTTAQIEGFGGSW